MQTVEGECKAISEQDRAVRDCLAVVVSEAVTDLSRIVVEAEIQDFIQNFMRHRRPRNVVKLLVDDIAMEVVASFVKGVAEVRSGREHRGRRSAIPSNDSLCMYVISWPHRRLSSRCRSSTCSSGSATTPGRQ